MQSIVLYGAGGHGKVIADIIEKGGLYTIAGFLDDEKTGECAGYSILGGFDAVPRLLDADIRLVIVGIGHNETRLALQDRLTAAGMELATMMHPSVQIARGAEVGAGTVIMPGAILGPDVRIGSGCIINTGATVDHDCFLGNGVHLSPGVHVAGGVQIGDASHMGIGSVAKENVIIGARVTVGAGSVVLASLPDDCVAYGVPAKIRPEKITPSGIPLSRPDISEEDIASVVEVLRGSQLSLGPRLPAFEKQMAEYVGVKHAVGVNSGTSALHLCMRALNIADGDEVITTPFSFVASANCMLFERAVPVFVDVLPDTLCINPALVEAAITPRTKAILAVDIFGYLCEWEALRAIADRHGLALIEDSCEALGSAKNGRKAGSFADCAVFGFYPNKQITTGEGGMLVTNSDHIAHVARSLCNQGRTPGDTALLHETLGYNYRLSDMQCALGMSQLVRLPSFMEKRDRVALWYEEHLSPLRHLLHLPSVQTGVDMSRFVYVVRLADRYSAADRDRVLASLRQAGIGCGNYFPCIHVQPLYRERFGYGGGEFPTAEAASMRTLALPFFPGLSKEDVARVCKALEETVHSLRL